MSRDFFPFVEESPENKTTRAHADTQASSSELLEVTYPARIAVYDDASAAPRVVVIEPQDVRSYLEEITSAVNRLSHEQGGTIPFMVIRELVENFIHAYFIAPTITILNGGQTIRFSDQGPGIKEKASALQFGTTSATEDMKRYIRGVGSGLPYVQHYMEDKGGSLTIEDNIAGGAIITISTAADTNTATSAGMQAASGTIDSNNSDKYATGQQAIYPGQGGYTIQQYPAAGTVVPQGANASHQPWQTFYGQAPQPYHIPQQAPYQTPYGIPSPGYMPGYPQQTMPPMPGYGSMPDPNSSYIPSAGGLEQQYSSAARTTQPTGSWSGLGSFTLTERQRNIMQLVCEQGQVGARDLTLAFGYSDPTWSREISDMVRMGILTKDRQKYRLTVVGQQLASSLM